MIRGNLRVPGKEQQTSRRHARVHAGFDISFAGYGYVPRNCKQVNIVCALQEQLMAQLEDSETSIGHKHVLALKHPRLTEILERIWSVAFNCSTRSASDSDFTSTPTADRGGGSKMQSKKHLSKEHSME